jgi:hypothetical protein
MSGILEMHRSFEMCFLLEYRRKRVIHELRLLVCCDAEQKSCGDNIKPYLTDSEMHWLSELYIN